MCLDWIGKFKNFKAFFFMESRIPQTHEFKTKKCSLVVHKARKIKCDIECSYFLMMLFHHLTSFVHCLQHLEFAKMKKKIAKELCDKEKLADSLLVVGESYQKLRDFRKASKWYNKSSEIYKVINNLEVRFSLSLQLFMCSKLIIIPYLGHK